MFDAKKKKSDILRSQQCCVAFVLFLNPNIAYWLLFLIWIIGFYYDMIMIILLLLFLGDFYWKKIHVSSLQCNSTVRGKGGDLVYKINSQIKGQLERNLRPFAITAQCKTGSLGPYNLYCTEIAAAAATATLNCLRKANDKWITQKEIKHTFLPIPLSQHDINI